MSYDALIDALSGYIETDADGVIRYLNAQRQRHRIDGPAVIHPSGTVRWYHNGLLHRTDGPAVEHSGGTKSWYQNGLRHRNDGPAAEWQSGTREWYQHGNLHREDGPAVIYTSGEQCFYLFGKLYKTEEEYQQAVRLLNLERAGKAVSGDAN